MDISRKFLVKIHPLVKKQDLPNLPKDLQEGFNYAIVPTLEIDPYGCNGIPNHDLERELDGWSALEIDEHGEAYRLVYRVDESPQKMSVEIISFDIHDPAYDKAKERVPKASVRKWG